MNEVENDLQNDPLVFRGKSGDYHVISEIGNGLLLAGKKGESFRYVIKLQPADAAMSAARFHREYHIGQSLRGIPGFHPCCDFGIKRGLAWVASEAIDGMELDAWAESLTTNREATIIKQFERLARAITQAHELGIVHCDIKSSNIIVDQKGEANVIDLGLARKRDAVCANDVRFVGTEENASPEQLLGKVPDIADDIYQFGVTLDASLSRRHPFDGASSSNKHLALRRNRSALGIPAHVRRRFRGLGNILSRLTAYESAQRYKSMSDVADDLQRCLVGQDVAATPLSLFERWSSIKARRQDAVMNSLAAIAAVALLLCAVSIISGWAVIDAKSKASVAMKAEFDAKLQIAKQDLDLKDKELKLKVSQANLDREASFTSAHRQQEMAYFLMMTGRPEQAILTLNGIIDRFKVSPIDDLDAAYVRGGVYSNLSGLYMMQEQPKKALEVALKAWSELEKIHAKNPKWVPMKSSAGQPQLGDFFISVAGARVQAGSPISLEEAKFLHNRGLEFATGSNSKPLAASFFRLCASEFLRLGEYQLAIEAVETARRLGPAFGAERVVDTVVQVSANTRLNRIDEALTAFSGFESLMLMERQATGSLQGLLLIDLALSKPSDAAFAKTQLDRAELALKSNPNCAACLGCQFGVSYLLLAKSIVMADQKDRFEAEAARSLIGALKMDQEGKTNFPQRFDLDALVKESRVSALIGRADVGDAIKELKAARTTTDRSLALSPRIGDVGSPVLIPKSMLPQFSGPPPFLSASR
jgi:serine/threonine protein kinase